MGGFQVYVFSSKSFLEVSSEGALDAEFLVLCRHAPVVFRFVL